MRKLLLFSLIITLSTVLVGCTKPIEEPDPIIVVNCELFPDREECIVDSDPVVIDFCEEDELDCIEEVEQILENLSLIEKVAQMIQAERGNITPSQVEQYGIGSILSGGGSHPSSYHNSVDDWYDMYSAYQDGALESSSGIPLIYGIDAVHGNNNVYGATIFPHNIGLGAANDPDLMYRIGVATAKEMKVTGISWTFGPALSVVQNISWGRTYEGLSENPDIQNNLTYSIITGLQTNGVSATAKHYIADGGTYNGQDQGNVIEDEATIKAIHLTPYYEAIRAGVDTIMISYSSIDGEKMHGSKYWINDVLKEEMGFKGFIISDWNAIHQLPGSFEDQIVKSINAGVDMLMEPYDWENAISTLKNAVDNGRISNDRIDDAVRRILTVKYNRGLLDDPYSRLDESDNFYTEEHQDLAREAVRKSLVLLKNDNDVLPLSKTENVMLVGPGIDNVGYQCGGWTTYWQGTSASDIGVGMSILAAFERELTANGASLVNDLLFADTVVIVLTELPYSESAGDNSSLTLTTGNSHPDNLAAINVAIQAQLLGKNVVAILISGRPLILEDYLQYFDSFVAAWLPGSEGGNGISDVIFGDYGFTGKLSFTWPMNNSQIGYNSNNVNYDPNSVLYPFGYGMSYND